MATRQDAQGLSRSTGKKAGVKRVVSVYRHQVRALRQIKCPFVLEAQSAGAVGHGMAGAVVVVGASL